MPPSSLKLLTTATSVEAAKPVDGKRTEYADGKVRGLALRVMPSGAKSWTLRYRTASGDQRRLSLGSPPAVGLAKARDEALKALGLIAGGSDPASAKQEARAKAKQGKVETVGDLMDHYLKAAEQGDHRPNARPKRASTIALDRYHVERLIKPRLGNIRLRALIRADVQAFLDQVRHEHAISTARHCRAAIRQAFNYAIRTELSVANPAALATLPRPAERERVLTPDELRAIWKATGEPTASNLALRLAAVTLQRGGEVAGLHADEVDLDARLWTIPGARTKNHRTHVVPLSALAVSLLEQAFRLTPAAEDGRNDPWVGFAFPGRGQKDKPMTRAAISRALGRIRLASRAKGDNPDHRPLADMTPHDLRRTGATSITGERIGLPRFIVSRVLNQMTDTGGAAAVTRVYDRNEYLAEKRKALDAWAGLLFETVGDKGASTNTPSRGSREPK